MKELIRNNNIRDQAVSEMREKESSSQARYSWYQETLHLVSDRRQEQFEELRSRWVGLWVGGW